MSRVTYSLKCYVCDKKFKTHRAVRKHFDNLHSFKRIEFERLKFYDVEEKEIPAPELGQLNIGTDNYKSGYLFWLAGVAEQLNSSLHPFLPGRWFNIDLIQVPATYFMHFVSRLGCQVDSIRCVPHKKPPTYTQSTTRVSYKLYDIDTFSDCIHEQMVVTLKESLLFSGTKEVNKSSMTLDEEIQAAMQRDTWSTRQTRDQMLGQRCMQVWKLAKGKGEPLVK